MKTLLFEAEKHFLSCHASTILPLAGGDVLCAYFAGTHEKHDDVGIWLSRKTQGRWQEPRLVAKDEPIPHWNPVLFEDGEAIRLVYKTGKTIPVWQSRTRVSFDGGQTFSEPTAYPAPHLACGPVRSKPLRLGDGTLLAPNSWETAAAWRPFIDSSTDGGAHFQKLADIPLNTSRPGEASFFAGKGAIQPALWQDKAGVHAFLRTTEGKIFRSDSDDLGKTWCEAYPTALPNNNSGLDVQAVGDDLYLVCNPIGADWGPRNPLHLLRSQDGGKTFSLFLELEPPCPDPQQKAEYSYPAMTVRDGFLYISYTYLRRQIAVWEIPLS